MSDRRGAAPRRPRPLLAGTGALLLSYLVLGAALNAQSPRLWIVVYDDDTAVDRAHRWTETLRSTDDKKKVDEAQRILDLADGENEKDAPDAFRVAMTPSEVEAETFFPIDDAVGRRLQGLSNDLRALYRARHSERADALARRFETSGDAAAFHLLRRRFRVTDAAARTLIGEGHRRLERGDVDLAIRHFEDALEATAVDGDDSPTRIAALAGGAFARKIEGENGVHLPAVADGALEAAWRFDFPEPANPPRRRPNPVIEPLERDGVVFLHTPFAAFALDAKSGAPIWRRDFVEKATGESGEIVRGKAPTERFCRGAADDFLYVFVVRDENERRLVALDRTTGRTLWIRRGLFDLPAPDALHPAVQFDDAPLLVGDDLCITALEAAAAPRSYAAALDRMTGDVRWVTNFGAGIPTAFQSADGDVSAADAASLPPAAVRGLFLVCDNLGSIAALEQDTGRPRWTHRYARRGATDDQRTGNATVSRGWDATGIRTERDQVFVAPDDADLLFVFFNRTAIDAAHVRSGKASVIAATMPRRGFQTIAATSDGAVFLVGKEARGKASIVDCVAPAAENRIRRWPSFAPLDGPASSPGALAQNALYVATARYVFRIDPATGALNDPVLAREADTAQGFGFLRAVEGGLLNATRTMVERLSPKIAK